MVLGIAAAATGLLAGARAGAARRSLAPIPEEEAISTHGPYEMGDCKSCHVGSEGPNPGKLRRAAPDLCFDCHEEFQAPVKGHPVSKRTCTACHSPHNARKRKLLL
jgi:predicted CXXCH cytochrome family protein